MMDVPIKDGLPASWWKRTGSLRPSVHILENRIPPDLRDDLELAAPCVSDELLRWFEAVTERLGASEALRRLPLNPEVIDHFQHPEEARLEILICSRQSMEELLDMPDAQGVHLVSTPDCDPFQEESPYAKIFRVAIVWDRDEFLAMIREEAAQDMDPERHLPEYVHSWLTTIFHEVEHVRLFAQNSGLLAPSEVDVISEDGFDHDLFDCSSGYGIRPLENQEGHFIWADTIEDARDLMEESVEHRGRRLMHEILGSDLDYESFLKAAGIEVQFSHAAEPG